MEVFSIVGGTLGDDWAWLVWSIAGALVIIGILLGVIADEPAIFGMSGVIAVGGLAGTFLVLGAIDMQHDTEAVKQELSELGYERINYDYDSFTAAKDGMFVEALIEERNGVYYIVPFPVVSGN